MVRCLNVAMQGRLSLEYIVFLMEDFFLIEILPELAHITKLSIDLSSDFLGLVS